MGERRRHQPLNLINLINLINKSSTRDAFSPPVVSGILPGPGAGLLPAPLAAAAAAAPRPLVAAVVGLVPIPVAVAAVLPAPAVRPPAPVTTRRPVPVTTPAVIGIPSDEWGESVHAVLVSSTGSDTPSVITLPELRKFCKQHIAGYKCPRSFEFVDSLPISAAGKILKTELRKPYWESSEKQVS